MMPSKVQQFQTSMRLMRSRNAEKQEEGFHLLLPEAGSYVEELIAEFQAETKDHGLKCWLLELLGEARSEVAIPLFVEMLDAGDEAFASWAIRGLKRLDTKTSRRILYERNKNNHGFTGLDV